VVVELDPFMPRLRGWCVPSLHCSWGRGVALDGYVRACVVAAAAWWGVGGRVPGLWADLPSRDWQEEEEGGGTHWKVVRGVARSLLSP